MEDELPNSFYIKEIEESRITEIVKFLPNSTAKDVYNLDINLIKKFSSVMIAPLTHLTNVSIRDCVFPNTWKKAVVTPFFKSGSKPDFKLSTNINLASYVKGFGEGCS